LGIVRGGAGCRGVDDAGRKAELAGEGGASVPTMTKADLVDEVAKVSNLTKKETELIVNTIFDSITGALAKAEKVELRGFGSFRVRRRNARRGRNPKTGSSVSVPEKRVPFFKVGKRLKELVNG
jgi:integration host factor subunit beta